MSKKRTIAQEQGQPNSRTQGSGTPGSSTDRQLQRPPGWGYEQYRGTQHGGQQYEGQGYQGMGAPRGGYSGGGYYPSNTYQPRDWRANWHDERHPKLKTMMAAYLERTNGRVHLAKLLNAAGKRQTDLPTLPQYVHPNGKPFLCWSSFLG